MDVEYATGGEMADGDQFVVVGFEWAQGREEDEPEGVEVDVAAVSVGSGEGEAEDILLEFDWKTREERKLCQGSAPVDTCVAGGPEGEAA